MEDGGTNERQRSLAAGLIFLIVISFQFASGWLYQLKKKRSNSAKELQLRREKKKLLKEASTLSQPSTYAQAAKLKRLALAKDKELAYYQNLNEKENGLYLKVLIMAKVLIYAVLLFWFWKVPVASISHNLVQPLGKLLSWKSGGVQNNYVKVGIIPWLLVSTRVSKFISEFLQTKQIVNSS